MQQENKSCYYTCWYVGVVRFVDAAIVLRGMRVEILVINTYKLEIKQIYNLFSLLKIVFTYRKLHILDGIAKLDFAQSCIQQILHLRR